MDKMENTRLPGNTELLKTAVQNSNIPAYWPYCFNSGCARRDTCVRYQAGTALDATTHTAGLAVYPAAARLEQCPHFKLLRTIRSAWGMARLFDNVRVSDAPLLRQRMKSMLGGNGTYYRYHHGTRRLKPEQQAQIRRLFASFGYDGIEFEHYQTEIDL